MIEMAPLLDITGKNDHAMELLRYVHSDLVLADFAYLYNPKVQLRQREEQLEGLANRLRPFLASPVIRAVLGQTDHVLRFEDAMRDGKIVLVNLNGGENCHYSHMRTLGVLLITDIVRCALLRDPNERRLKPFHVYLDEFPDFITRDIARALDQTRKFKVFMTLAHQHMAQLAQKGDEWLAHSVMTNCRNRFIFGGLSYDDLEMLAKNITAGHLSLNDVKYEHWDTAYRPVEETREVISESASISDGTADAFTEALNWSKTKSRTETNGTSIGASRGISEQYTHSLGQTQGIQDGRMTSESSQEGNHVSHSEGKAKSSSDTIANTTGSGTTDAKSASTSYGNSYSVYDPVRRTLSHNTNNAVNSAVSKQQSTTHSRSDATSESSSDSYGRTFMRGHAHGLTRALSNSEMQSQGFAVGENQSEQESQQHSIAEGEAEQRGGCKGKGFTISHTDTRSRSRSVVPYTYMEAYSQLRQRVFFTLRELLELSIGALKRLPTGACCAVINHGKPTTLWVANIEAIEYNRSMMRKIDHFASRSVQYHQNLYLSAEDVHKPTIDRQTIVFGKPYCLDATIGRTLEHPRDAEKEQGNSLLA